jgi:uncharacterized membrane protein
MTREVPARGRPLISYKIHWHVVLTHFPVGFFVASGGLMFLHLFTQNRCYDLAAFVTLAGGAIAMVPTTLTGWSTWKNRYKGLRSQLFLAKVRMSFAMLAISAFLVVLRILFEVESLDLMSPTWHAVYFSGVMLLVVGAIAEGYFGGRLNHH